MEKYIILIPIVGFLAFIFASVVHYIIKGGNKYRPPFEYEPKPGDKYKATVHTFYFSRICRDLSVSYHPTKEEAQKAVKKYAQWHDDYGGIHPDIGIRWVVEKLNDPDQKAS